MSDDCKDFIWRCLDKKSESRLGSSKDVEEVLNHPWLAKINITNLMKKRIKAPFIPNKEIDDTSCFDKETIDEEASLTFEPPMLLSKEN
jgi:hypothetical protein